MWGASVSRGISRLDPSREPEPEGTDRYRDRCQSRYHAQGTGAHSCWTDDRIARPRLRWSRCESRAHVHVRASLPPPERGATRRGCAHPEDLLQKLGDHGASSLTAAARLATFTVGHVEMEEPPPIPVGERDVLVSTLKVWDTDAGLPARHTGRYAGATLSASLSGCHHWFDRSPLEPIASNR